MDNAILGKTNKSFICLRFHHAIGDGWSLFKLIVKLCERSDLLQSVPQFKSKDESGWIPFMLGAGCG